MSEVEVGAQLIGRRYMCDECGGEMARDGSTVLASCPAQYPHVCPNGHRVNLLRTYPGYNVLIEPAAQRDQFVRERFTQPDAERAPSDFMRQSYDPCARQHEPGRVCIQPDGHA